MVNCPGSGGRIDIICGVQSGTDGTEIEGDFVGSGGRSHARKNLALYTTGVAGPRSCKGKERRKEGGRAGTGGIGSIRGKRWEAGCGGNPTERNFLKGRNQVRGGKERRVIGDGSRAVYSCSLLCPFLGPLALVFAVSAHRGGTGVVAVVWKGKAGKGNPKNNNGTLERRKEELNRSRAFIFS